MGEGTSAVLEDRVIVPLVTPLKKGGFVSYGTVKRICRRIKGAGINSVLVAGKTGGIESITDDQRAFMLKVVKDNFDGHIFYCIGDPESGVLADGTHGGFARVMSHLDNAANAGGVDAVVVPTLFYPGKAHHPDLASPSIENYFMGVLKRAKQVGMPIIFYNNPAMTGAEIPLGLVKELSADEMVLGIKDSSGDMQYFGELLNIAMPLGIVEDSETDDSFPGIKLGSSGDIPPGVDFKVYQGSEKLIAESMAMGADGIVPSLGNIFPELVAAAAWDFDLQHIVNEVGVDIYSGYKKIVEGILYGLSCMGVYGAGDGIASSPNLAPVERSIIRKRIRNESYMQSRRRTRI